MSRVIIGLAGLTLVASVAGCRGAEQAATTTKPDPAEQTRAKVQQPRAEAKDDLTKDLLRGTRGKSWAKKVASVTETEPGRLTVVTSIIDPRGGSGSPAAKTAIQVCEAAVVLLDQRGTKNPYVSVMEKDGTTYVLFGHPSYPGGCSEV
jgi:hypothetical protein